MASSLALKKLVSFNPLPTSLRVTRRAIPASLRFHTNECDERRYSCPPDPNSLADVFDPSKNYYQKSLSQRLKMMDQFIDSPLFGTTVHGILPGRWEAKQTNDGFYNRMYMPGLRKENVSIKGADNYMSIHGYCSDGDRGFYRAIFSTRIDLPHHFYKCDQIKAVMKDGVLNIMVCSFGGEERDEYFWVEVE